MNNSGNDDRFLLRNQRVLWTMRPMFTHIDKINDALSFIETNLKEPLHLSEIACHSRLSERHLQRLFRQFTGDTVKSYVRGRRLTLAAQDLLTNNSNILDVAIDYQFLSQATFTRAFQNLFQMPPGFFRRTGLIHLPQKKHRIGNEQLDYFISGLSLEPTLVRLPQMHFVGMKRCLRSFSLPADADNLAHILSMSQTIKANLGEIRHLTTPPSDQLFSQVWTVHKPPANPRTIDEMEVFTAYQVDSINRAPGFLNTTTVPSRYYAAISHQGTVEEINLAISYFNTVWLPRSGKSIAHAPFLIQRESHDEDTAFGSVRMFFPPIVRSILFQAYPNPCGAGRAFGAKGQKQEHTACYIFVNYSEREG